ncbi:hypothetical protein [Arthrobacter sp. NicSoilB11]|jgi:hypothetical protein|uniref:hypothetical protein n=1 Tax=Arthrobacter sp. NicSoilB11 TaxID=2830999 RepID=UPI001CC65B83|nr:hypothetical protein [Arthrobacter sp. NicSoilB11]
MKKLKASVSMVIAGGFLMAGAAVAYGALEPSAPSKSASVSDREAHPECYDEAKANDPSDFCYKTIGEWNSKRLTADDVRSQFSSQEMAKNGMSPETIRQYYPEYTPAP